MAVWTAPTTRSTGALVSASIWNTDIVENLKYLKDSPVFDGDISVGDDLFLTSTGAVINFASGDVTITHSSNALAFAGGTYTFNSNAGAAVANFNQATTGKTGLYLQENGTNVGAFAQLGLIAGTSDRNIAIFAETGFDFNVCTNGSPTVRVKVNTAGELMVGYTADQGAYLLQVNSQIFATNATIATSDARFKTDVQPVQDGLAAVRALRPVAFRWKPHPIHNFIAGTDVGFLAQDVQQALAGRAYVETVVTTNGEGEDEFLGMADAKLIPLLVAAVQELAARVDALTAH